MKLHRAIILGGGYSMRNGLWTTPIDELPLWYKISSEFTIGTNFTFHWFVPTVLMYSDYQFYGSQKEYLKNIPLILGKKDGAYKRNNGVQHDENVILLKECERIQKVKWNTQEPGLHPHYWGKEAWTKGWYSSQLIGLKALNLAIALDCKEIFLLGFDAGCDEKDRTHFYSDTEIGQYTWQGSQHSGVGKDKRGFFKTGNYNKLEELNKFWFQPFEEELKKGIKIYNVSPNSKIDTFPKITYDEFYKKISLIRFFVDHSKIRTNIKKRLNHANI